MNDQSKMLHRRSYLARPPNPNFNILSSTNPNYYNLTHQNDPLGVTNICNYPVTSDLYAPNRSIPRKFHRKKKSDRRFVPYAPRNTTSFLIRAKKSGGIAFPVSPCPVTPAVLPTPVFSPAREVVVDTAKEEWGVNGYGTMSGLIRLREIGRNGEEGDRGCGSSESDVEVERRLDHDLSRFEMIYPNNNRDEFDNRDSFIGRAEDENMTLKERLFLMESELEDLRRRVLVLEMRRKIGRGNVEEFGSDNEGGCYVYSGRSVGGAGDD